MLNLDNLPALLSSSVPIALVVCFLAGVFTSVSPCIMSMVPVVLGYVGAFGAENNKRNLIQVLFLVLGLATSFAALGMVAVLLGGIFGNIGKAAPLFLGTILILMGLNLMQLIKLPFQGLTKLPMKLNGLAGAYILGLFFGLAASPCASAVLIIILSFVGVSQKLFLGGALLFVYGLGHGLPLLIIGGAAGALRSFRSFSRYWDLTAYVAGLLFVGLGVYMIASNL